MAERLLRKCWDGQLPVSKAVFEGALLRQVADLDSGYSGRLMLRDDGQPLILVSDKLSDAGQRFVAAFLLGMALRGKKTAAYGSKLVLLNHLSLKELRWGHQFACALLVPRDRLCQLLGENSPGSQDVRRLASRFLVPVNVIQRQVAGY